MKRRVGRYTKDETAELRRMFEEGYSVYKICRNLNRSQKSIRNNLIRLGKIEGEITPRRYVKAIDDYEISNNPLLSRFYFLILLSFICFVMVVNPHFNPLEILIFNIMRLFG